MIEGNIIHVSGSGFHVNSGAKSGVGVGMKLVIIPGNQGRGYCIKRAARYRRQGSTGTTRNLFCKGHKHERR